MTGASTVRRSDSRSGMSSSKNAPVAPSARKYVEGCRVLRTHDVVAVAAAIRDGAVFAAACNRSVWRLRPARRTVPTTGSLPSLSMSDDSRGSAGSVAVGSSPRGCALLEAHRAGHDQLIGVCDVAAIQVDFELRAGRERDRSAPQAAVALAGAAPGTIDAAVAVIGPVCSSPPTAPAIRAIALAVW